MDPYVLLHEISNFLGPSQKVDPDPHSSEIKGSWST